MIDEPRRQKSESGFAENAASYSTNAPITYEQYLKLPEEPGIQHEVLEGILVREPSPTVMHQRVSANLQYVLREYLRAIDPNGVVLAVPLDVILSDITIVQPDLLYIPGSDQDALKATHIFIVPKLIVEIVSPTTKRKDRFKKIEIYRKAGVAHYWIVDPDAQMIEAYMLKDQSYVRVVIASETTFTHPEFPGLEFEYNEIFPD